MGAKMPYMRKEKTKLKNKLDKLFSLKIRQKGFCEASGEGGMNCSGQLQCAHIFSRVNMNLRWDKNNALCLCSAHHLFWAHKNPIEFTEFVKKKLGKSKYEKLRIKARQIRQWSVEELEKEISKYEHSSTD